MSIFIQQNYTNTHLYTHILHTMTADNAITFPKNPLYQSFQPYVQHPQTKTGIVKEYGHRRTNGVDLGYNTQFKISQQLLIEPSGLQSFNRSYGEYESSCSSCSEEDESDCRSSDSEANSEDDSFIEKDLTHFYPDEDYVEGQSSDNESFSEVDSDSDSDSIVISCYTDEEDWESEVVRDNKEDEESDEEDFLAD